MRLISDILEHRGVDVVFSGHVHNYQRTRPLKFLARPGPTASSRSAGRYWSTATSSSTSRSTASPTRHPSGVIYIVTGAGGAGAYDPDQTDNEPTWQPFTVKLVTDVYSFTPSTSTGRR